MNYFEEEQLAKLRAREARRAGARTQLAKLVPSHFWARRRRARIRLRVVLLLLCVYVLLGGAQLAVRLGWFHERKAKQSVRVEGCRTLPAAHN